MNKKKGGEDNSKYSTDLESKGSPYSSDNEELIAHDAEKQVLCL